MKYNTLFCLISILCVTSCSLVTPVDKQLDQLVTEIESRKSSMTDVDWEQADQNIEAFRQKIDASRKDMTVEEISNANKALGRYAGLRLKSGLNDFKNSLEDLGDQLKGMADELADTTKN
jgi:hypothetical protein